MNQPHPAPGEAPSQSLIIAYEDPNPAVMDPVDSGARPLQSSKYYWWTCPGILINGGVYTGMKLDPDAPLQLNVRVRNTGALLAETTVRVHLYTPATGIILQAIASTGFPVPPNTAKLSPPMHVTLLQVFAGKLPATPDHVCVIAVASSGLSHPLKLLTDPHIDLDPHYAQLNLQTLAAAPGQLLSVPFHAAGGMRGGAFTVAVRQLPEADQHVERLTPEELTVTDALGQAPGPGPLRVELRAHQSQALQMVLRVPDNAAAGQQANLVIEQTPDDGREDSATGGIGVHITVTAR